MKRALDIVIVVLVMLVIVVLTVEPMPGRAFFVLAAVLVAVAIQSSAGSVMSLAAAAAAALVSTFMLREFGRCPTIVGNGADLPLFVFILCCVIGAADKRLRTAAANVVAGIAVAFFYPLSDTLIVGGTMRPVLPLLAVVSAVVLELLAVRVRHAVGSFTIAALAPAVVLLPSSLLLMLLANDAATSALATAYILPSLAAPAVGAGLLLTMLSTAPGRGWVV